MKDIRIYMTVKEDIPCKVKINKIGIFLEELERNIEELERNIEEFEQKHEEIKMFLQQLVCDIFGTTSDVRNIEYTECPKKLSSGDTYFTKSIYVSENRIDLHIREVKHDKNISL